MYSTKRSSVNQAQSIDVLKGMQNHGGSRSRIAVQQRERKSVMKKPMTARNSADIVNLGKARNSIGNTSINSRASNDTVKLTQFKKSETVA